MNTPRRLLVPALGLLAIACGQDAAPAWVHLARHFRPPDPGDAVRTWGEGGLAYRVSAGEDESGFWLELDVPPERWEADAGIPGLWWAPRPFTGLVPSDSYGRVRLRSSDGQELLKTTPPAARELVAQGTTCFLPTPNRLGLGVPDGGTPPAGLVIGAYVPLGSPRDGVWRARSSLLTADGLSLLSGQRTEIETAIAPGSTLTFATAALGVEPGAALTFRVRLRDEVLLEHHQECERRSLRRHTIELPQASGGAPLVFEVSGDPGLGTFLTPLIGPARRTAGRPDVVLFLADTFRADNLALYGGEPELAPNLNRFARDSVRFHRTRAPASWTLPSVSSLLTGMYPPQHGVEKESTSLSGDLVTLSEQLARFGYRTGAITDSGFFSADYGLDQGFEVFQEVPILDWNLERTFQWALDFLDHGDGRPTFLFVHTYRTHYPYRVGIDEDYSGWVETLKRAGVESLKAGHSPEELMPFAEDFLALYRGAVTGLDLAFGGFWDALEERGFPERGLFLLTSDHGEAFGEHAQFGHGGQLWGEKIRVPLLIDGPGLDGRDVHQAASLVDLPRTIAASVGIPLVPAWLGRDLLALDRDRPLFAFNAGVGGESLAILSGTRKVLTPRDATGLRAGEFDAAFDLETDPEETVNQKDTGARWPGELCRSLADAVEALSDPLVQAGSAELSAERRAELQAIGYGD